MNTATGVEWVKKDNSLLERAIQKEISGDISEQQAGIDYGVVEMPYLGGEDESLQDDYTNDFFEWLRAYKKGSGELPNNEERIAWREEWKRERAIEW